MISKNNFLIAFVCLLSFAAAERLFTFLSVRTQLNRKSRHFIANTHFHILISGYLASVLITICEFLFIVDRISLFISATGLVMLFFAFVLRALSAKALGPEWSYSICCGYDQPLVTSGVYRYIAHPYHFSVALELLGFSLFSNARYSFLFITVFQIPLLIHRIIIEETVLKRFHGYKYINYRRTKVI